LGKGDIGGDPVAHLGPFRVVTRGCIGVGEGDDVGHIRGGDALGVRLVFERDGGGILEVLRLDGVA
jgi:hypothetical protein